MQVHKPAADLAIAAAFTPSHLTTNPQFRLAFEFSELKFNSMQVREPAADLAIAAAIILLLRFFI